MTKNKLPKKRINCYGKGRRFEYEVKKQLEEEGYYVIRSAKSSFPDLIAIKDKEILAIECKNNSRITKEEEIKAGRFWIKTGLPVLFVVKNGK